MSKVKTYLDTNVLIAVFQGRENRLVIEKVKHILDDTEHRDFVSSGYLRLELLPKPMFYKRQSEIEFLTDFLNTVQEEMISSTEITQRAIDLAARYDLQPMDALHLSAAIQAHTDEFITLEKIR
jgi:hypothetical protein